MEALRESEHAFHVIIGNELPIAALTAGGTLERRERGAARLERAVGGAGDESGEGGSEQEAARGGAPAKKETTIDAGHGSERSFPRVLT